MTSQDSIADMLTRIRNAIMVNKNTVLVPTSKIKVSICEVLKNNKFIANFEVNDSVLNITINEEGQNARISHIERVSKPGKRIYSNASKIKSYMQGRGLFVLSTPNGLLTNKEAKVQNVGGEVLFKIY